MRRRITVLVVLGAIALTAAGAYVQAQRTDAASDPGWNAFTGPPESTVSTPLLSVRRAPAWLSAPVAEARLAEQIEAFAASAGGAGQGAATCVALHRNGEPLARANAASPLVPSSLMKLVTATAILEKAGPAATYTTEVFARSDTLDSPFAGALAGDIYLVGRGDPVLSTSAYSRRFDEPVAATEFADLARDVAASLRRRGITVIAGSIVADESRFPEEERDYAGLLPLGIAPAWEPSVVLGNAAGPLSALLLNDGYTSFSPEITAAGARRNVRSSDPAAHAAEVFESLLAVQGVMVVEEPRKGTAPALAERVSLGAVESPPVADIVARMIRYDDNTIAEMLLKEVGRRSSGSARVEAVLGVDDVLQRLLGLPTEGVVIVDGSGLSAKNRLTCDLVAQLLVRADADSPVLQAMSLVGVDGSFSDCPIDAGAASSAIRVHGDSRPGVSTLAGAANASNGDLLTFAAVSNSEEARGSASCDDFQQQLIGAVAGHPYGSGDADGLLSPRPAVSAGG